MAAKPKPPAKKKPTRKPRRNTATGFLDRPPTSASIGDPRSAPSTATGWVTERERFAHIEGRLDRFEARLDKMADALAPALHAWRNIRSRIPRWLLSLGENGEQDTRRRSQDSEE